MTEPQGPPNAAIEARGALIPLFYPDGDRIDVRLRYSIGSAAALEREFGSLGAAPKALEKAAAVMAVDSGRATEEQVKLAEGYDGPGLFALLERCITPGLRGVKVRHPYGDGEVWLADEPDLVGDFLSMTRLWDYVQAFTAAFGQAFDTGAAPGPTTPPRAKGSPSPRGGTSRSGGTASGPRSSGR